MILFGAGVMTGLMMPLIGLVLYKMLQLHLARVKVRKWTGKPVQNVHLDWELTENTLGFFQCDSGDIFVSPWMEAAWMEYVLLHEIGHRHCEHDGTVPELWAELEAEVYSANHLPHGHTCEDHLDKVIWRLHELGEDAGLPVADVYMD